MTRSVCVPTQRVSVGAGHLLGYLGQHCLDSPDILCPRSDQFARTTRDNRGAIGIGGTVRSYETGENGGVCAILAGFGGSQPEILALRTKGSVQRQGSSPVPPCRREQCLSDVFFRRMLKRVTGRNTNCDRLNTGLRWPILLRQGFVIGKTLWGVSKWGSSGFVCRFSGELTRSGRRSLGGLPQAEICRSSVCTSPRTHVSSHPFNLTARLATSTVAHAGAVPE